MRLTLGFFFVCQPQATQGSTFLWEAHLGTKAYALHAKVMTSLNSYICPVSIWTERVDMISKCVILAARCRRDPDLPIDTNWTSVTISPVFLLMTAIRSDEKHSVSTFKITSEKVSIVYENNSWQNSHSLVVKTCKVLTGWLRTMLSGVDERYSSGEIHCKTAKFNEGSSKTTHVSILLLNLLVLHLPGQYQNLLQSKCQQFYSFDNTQSCHSTTSPFHHCALPKTFHELPPLGLENIIH